MRVRLGFFPQFSHYAVPRISCVPLTDPQNSSAMAGAARTSKAPDERHIFCEIDHVDLLHMGTVHLPEGTHLERHAQPEDNQQ
jgi:hypothetical protein